MKIKIESKELKSLLEKVTNIVPKKSSISILESVKIKATRDKLLISGTDIELFLTVSTNNFQCIEDGEVLISSNEIKIITKLAGEITLETITDIQGKVSNDKKSLSIKFLTLEDYISFPELENIFDDLSIEINESDFTKSINKLVNFIDVKNANNRMMAVYNINVTEQQIEALDGHRIGINKVDMLHSDNIKNIIVSGEINRVLKKVLSEKSDDTIKITTTDKYIFFHGNDFTFIQRIIEGEYFKIDQFLSNDYNFKFKVNTSELMDIAKFNIDMMKADAKEKIPMSFYLNKESNKQHIYFDTKLHKSVDKIELQELEMTNNDILIAFNPNFIKDALNVLENDNALISGTKEKAPITISDNDHTYIILPVNISDKESIISYINNL